VKKMQWRGDERILVMRCDDIGQLIMATPSLRAIRESVPEGHITLLTSHTAGGLMPCLEDVDEIIPMTAVWNDKKRDLPFDPERELGFVEELRDGKFDAAIILTNQTQSSQPAAYACYMAGIECRVGRSAETAGSLLTHRVRGFGQGHEIERCLEVVAACGMRTHDLRPRLGRDEKLRESVDQFLKNHGVLGSPYVVVHAGPIPGATEQTTAAFAGAMVEVARRFGYTALMTGLPQERVAVEWVAGEAGTPAVVIAGETSVAELAAIIEGAELVITGNTSPAHIASAYNVPSLVIYEDHLPPSQWLPWSRSECAGTADEDLGEKLVALMGASEGGMAMAPALAS
jgi:ADP-heptose:LPS heptosyltransferase